MRVTLGGFELNDFEKPDFISLGGKQSLAVREFPGGNTSIQDLGPSYRQVTWSGMFVGADAYDRMMTVGLMRTAGKPVKLTAGKITMTVMLEEFLPDYKNDRRIPFSITVRRVVDNRPGASGGASQVVDAVDSAAIQVARDNPPVQQPETYVVKAGDTLSRIAANLKGNANGWEKIYKDNQSILKNGPHNIQPGMKLVIKDA